jgi:hypothetical protein
MRHRWAAVVGPGQCLVVELDARQVDGVGGQLHRHVAADVAFDEDGRLVPVVVADEIVEPADDRDPRQLRPELVDLGDGFVAGVLEDGVGVVLELLLDIEDGLLVVGVGLVTEQLAQPPVDLLTSIERDRARVDLHDLRQPQLR